MKYEVGPSAIHGIGVFARRAIQRDECIGAFVGEPTTKDGSHVLWVWDWDEGRWQGYRGCCELRYLNHQRRANSAFFGLELYALRSIDAGEEITIDYGPEAPRGSGRLSRARRDQAVSPKAFSFNSLSPRRLVR